MFNLDYEFARGVDPHAWAIALKHFWSVSECGPDESSSPVFPDRWQPPVEWRQVEVFGEDRRRTDHPSSRPA